MEHLLTSLPELREALRKPLLFLDYDGTLTKIAERPELATLPESLRKRLGSLREVCRVVVISGRGLRDLKRMVGVRGLYYAGNHGLELSGPGLSFVLPQAKSLKPLIRKICRQLEREVRGIRGALVEDKGLTASLHYRLVHPSRVGELRRIAEKVVGPHPRIRITEGKKVFELKPDLPWDKGRAALLLRKLLDPGRRLTPVYVGDDRTDEDAFSALNPRGGLTVLVSKKPIKSRARFFLRDTDEVEAFLRELEFLVKEDEKK